MELKSCPEIESVYKFVSKLDNNSLNVFFRNVFKVSYNSHHSGRRYIIVDATSIPVDINTVRKKSKIGIAIDAITLIPEN